MTAIPEPVLTKQEKKARKAPILLTAIETDHVAGGAPRSGQRRWGAGQGLGFDGWERPGRRPHDCRNAHDRYLPA